MTDRLHRRSRKQSWKERRERAFFYLLDRLREASTIRALVMLAGGGLGWANPKKLEIIVPLAMLLAGVIGAMFPDHVRSRRSYAYSSYDRDDSDYRDNEYRPRRGNVDDPDS